MQCVSWWSWSWWWGAKGLAEQRAAVSLRGPGPRQERLPHPTHTFPGAPAPRRPYWDTIAAGPPTRTARTARTACRTAVGDTIPIAYNNRKYFIDIVEARPGDAISVIETDCNVSEGVGGGGWASGASVGQDVGRRRQAVAGAAMAPTSGSDVAACAFVGQALGFLLPLTCALCSFALNAGRLCTPAGLCGARVPPAGCGGGGGAHGG